MSYILEALRKVEQQREHVQAHGLLSPRRYYGEGTAATSMKRQLFLLAVASGAVLSVGLVIYRVTDYKYSLPPQATATQIVPSGAEKEHTAFLPDRRDEHFSGLQTVIPSQNARLASTPRAESPRQAPAREMLGQNGQEEAKSSKSGGEPNPALEKKPTTEQPVAPPRDQHTEVAAVHKGLRRNTERETVQHSAATSLPEQLASANMTSSPQAQFGKEPQSPAVQVTTPAAPLSPAEEAELPAALPSQLQSLASRLSVDGFVFSPDPAQRVVIINMKLYSEGQNTPDGITVEAIRQNYVVCSYQGQRFRLLR